MLLVFDVGGTFIKWALLNKLSVIEKNKVRTPSVSFDELISCIWDIRNKFKDKSIDGLAFSMPGTIDSSIGYIKQGGNLRYNDHRFFKDELEEIFSLPVTIENDARCAALAEKEIGELKHIDNGIVMVVGTGLGGAIIENNKLISGTHNYSGELSLMVVGNIREEGMNALLGNKVGMKPFLEKAKHQLGLSILSGESLLTMVKNGHEEANELFNQYLDAFAQAMFTLQMVVDPERFVIGGGVSEDPFFVERLEKKFKSIVDGFPIKISVADIKSTKFGNLSNILGAAIHFESTK